MFFKKTLIISSLFAIVSMLSTIHGMEITTSNPPRDIVQGFRDGDAREVSKHFNTSIELIINRGSRIYSKAQAEQILRTFFNDNSSPTGRFTYTHLHGSDRDNVQYYIGELHTGKGMYRVTMYMKDQLIHRMIIESND